MSTQVLAGKVVLLTGGAQGMGATHARRLVEEGARVVAVDVKDELGEAVAASLGGAMRYRHLDITDPAAWKATVKFAESAFGPVDVLVNNAAISPFATIEEATAEEFGRVLAVNVGGTFNGIKAVLPRMIERRAGSIINISSVSGMKGSNHLHAYTTSKWAVRGLTKSVALDVGRHGIRVNSIHPGQIETPAAEGFDYPLEGIALGRTGRPDEISSLVIYLASDASSFSTGSEFVADGGEMAGTPQALM